MFDIQDLQKKAQYLRREILEAVATAGKGHIGGALSCIDILTVLYYSKILNYNPKNPKMDNRDRFILSKGHNAIALYVILADLGFFDKEELKTYNQNGSRLPEHPDQRLPGIEINSGSLGHGLGIGTGMAYAAKLDKKDYNTFVLMGDGECYEGSIWEAAMLASSHNLNNLIGIVDRNGLCIHGSTEDVNRLEPFESKWKAFGWETHTVNGHDFNELFSVFNSLKNSNTDNPKIVVANAIKGKGISFMENKKEWHHGVPKGELLERARRELAI